MIKAWAQNHQLDKAASGMEVCSSLAKGHWRHWTGGEKVTRLRAAAAPMQVDSLAEAWMPRSGNKVSWRRIKKPTRCPCPA